MELIRELTAVLQPLFDSPVLVTSIVARQRLHRKHTWVIENFIFFVQNGQRFLCCLVFIKVAFSLGYECSLLNNKLVLFNNVGVACWQSLNRLKLAKRVRLFLSKMEFKLNRFTRQLDYNNFQQLATTLARLVWKTKRNKVYNEVSIRWFELPMTHTFLHK